MKYVVYLCCLLLTGCGSLKTDRMFGDNLLNTAPRDELEVRYPEWGSEPEPEVDEVQSPEHIVNYSSGLSDFLASSKIAYEIIPGNFPLVRIKKPIYFASGSSNVSSESKPWLIQLGLYLNNHTDIDIVVDGHADNTGSEMLNDKLSQKRAEAVKSLIGAPQAHVESIYARGYGSSLPVCQETITGSACNRRVDLYFILPR